MISVIVPTYNEVSNVDKLCEKLNEMSSQCREFEVIIVDDQSQDGTAAQVSVLQAGYPWLILIERRDKPDLSRSVLEGIKRAKNEIIVVMDADLSHDPLKIPELVSPLLSSTADFVVGSRFTKGGKVDFDWPLYRRFNAWVAKWLAQGLVKVSDPLSGFFAFKQKELIKADLLNPLGYKIGLELMVKLHSQHIVEVPIYFADRYQGKSKLGLKQQLQYIGHLLRLYRYRFFEEESHVKN